MTTTEAALRDDAEAMAVLTKMIEDRSSWAANNQRMLDLLQPEWARFEAREGHNVYVARIYADHTSSLRKDRKELAALEYALAALSQPSPASSTAGEGDALAVARKHQAKWIKRSLKHARKNGLRSDCQIRDIERAKICQEIADEIEALSLSSGEPASVAVEALGEIVPVGRGGPFGAVRWYSGGQPPVGTKLYSALSKPTPVEAGLGEAIFSEVHNKAGWSLELHFGKGDEARDRMRAVSDSLRSLAALSETQPPRETSTETKESGE